MALASPIQNNFNSGEVTPLFYGRVNYQKYPSAVALMQNMIPQVQGGATRRTGTVYTNPTKLNGTSYLRRFVFSNGDAFIMEFGDFYVRFYRNRAQVNVVGAAAYNGATVYAKDAFVTSVGIQYISLQAGNVGNTPASSPLFWRAQDAYEISTPYAIADVPSIRLQQSGDVLYIAHPSYEPRKLIRSALTSWAFSIPTFLDGPYLPINSTATTLAISVATVGTGRTLTASALTNINNGVGFVAGDVGRIFRIKHSTTWGYGRITAILTALTATVDVIQAFGATTASATWRMGEWSTNTGYPSVVFMFEDRLGWAASPIAPITLNMSKSGDYENMAPTDAASVVAADSALQFRINAKQQDPIRWVYEDEKGLLIGTKGAEYVIRSSTTGDAISAINYPSARRTTKYGSSNVEPVEAGKTILFPQTAKRKLREMGYRYEVDGFVAPDLTILAEHMTEGNLAQLVYQQEPFSLVWARMESGALVAMTYDRDEDIVGWHRHPIGGYYNAGQTEPARVESIETIPSPTGDQDDLWMIVARYIDGGIKRYVEYLSPFNKNYSDVKYCYFVDGGKTYDLGADVSTVNGLDHLEGQTLDVLVDGKPQPQVTVTGGAITFRNAGKYIHAGLPYIPRIRTLRPEVGSVTGTSQGKTKRSHKLSARFHQTVGVRVGRGFADEGVVMDDIDFRSGSHIMGQAVPLFSGDKNLDYEDDYTTEGQVAFEQRQPLPWTLLAIMPETNTQDAG